MAHVQDLWEKTIDGRRVRTSRYGKGNRWQARYLDPDGRERIRTFARKQDAERFVVTVRADVLRGAYVDPDAGKVTFAEFAERWLAAQTFDESSREATSFGSAATPAATAPPRGDMVLEGPRPILRHNAAANLQPIEIELVVPTSELIAEHGQLDRVAASALKPHPRTPTNDRDHRSSSTDCLTERVIDRRSPGTRTERATR